MKSSQSIVMSSYNNSSTTKIEILPVAVITNVIRLKQVESVFELKKNDSGCWVRTL